MKRFLILIAAALCIHARAADRPNILWIVTEDNAWNWLGCYGNKDAVTPQLDALAKESLRYTHAYSNAPVCAVARSTILNGAYAVTQGTQHMRSRHPIPEIYKPYVSYFRELGYYCTNNSKTDYNFEGNDKKLWNACSGKATYKNRPDGKPFLAVFNLGVSHESSLFPKVVAANRRKGIIPETTRMAPGEIMLPPYLPDLPEIRSDIAIYQDVITAMDAQVGKALDDLKQAGLADDTIVFYYGDHGGIIPRGKRYLEDTGVRVPLLVRIPEKWRTLAPALAGATVDEVVSFVDFAPTLLSLAGLEKPPQMQGRAFLGEKRAAPPADNIAFLYADRFDEIYGMRRGITDGRWKYIRCFTPHLPAAPYSYYQFEQPGWAAWRKAWEDGKLKSPYNAIWETPQPVERLFDTSADPMEVANLAADPAHAERLEAMRARLKSKMIDAADTGIVPEPMFATLAPDRPIASYVATRKADFPELVSLAFLASSGNKENLPELISKFSSEDPLTRYWAAQGCLILGKSAAPATDGLIALLDDPQAAVRVAAAHALAVMENPRGKAALLAELEKSGSEYDQQTVTNALTRIGAIDEIPDSWVKRTRRDKNAGAYLKRLAERLAKERK